MKATSGTNTESQPLERPAVWHWPNTGLVGHDAPTDGD